MQAEEDQGRCKPDVRTCHASPAEDRLQCDEIHPSCFNCTRHGVLCSFASDDSPPVTVWSPSKGATRSPGHASPAAGSPSTEHAGSQTGSVSQSRLPGSLDGLGQSWTCDLELMHHYCTVTSNTLAHHEGARHVWRTVFPQEGYTHEYIMHGVLSLAALHKASLIPSRRKTYLTRAAHHYSIGQESFTALLQDVTSTNWRPVFCFATVVIAYVLCLPAQSGADSAATTPVSKTLQLFSVTKGIKAVLLPFIPQLNHTSLAPLVDSVWLISLDPPPDSYVIIALPLKRQPLQILKSTQQTLAPVFAPSRRRV